MDPELEEEARALVESAVAFVASADVGLQGLPEAGELRRQWRRVEELREETQVSGSGSGSEPLKPLALALALVELVLFQTVKTELAGRCAALAYLPSVRQQMVMARLGEVLWTVKDALELAKEAEDKHAEVAALKALARVHLSRLKELDAPVAAITEATKALGVLESLGEANTRLHAEVLFVLGDAQLTKALQSPFSAAREEALEAAAKTMRDAAEVYRKLEDQTWQGRAMLGAALALVGLEDEDQQMDGERLAEDAKDLFHDAGELDLEVVAMMLIVKCRITTSGLDCALLSAEDAAEDWKEEGGRPTHLAIALHTAASIYFQLKERAWTRQPSFALRLWSFSGLPGGAELRPPSCRCCLEWSPATSTSTRASSASMRPW
ncbi:unnamed protein product [Effrenium voratum]|nr:unnamed protein product [Effrenium voratum]